MGKNGIKYYAVRKGRIPGIYTSWNECQQQIKKFSCAEFKSFNTLSEAEEYMKKIIKINENEKFDSNTYISGSFNASISVFGYGGLIFHNGQKYKIIGNVNNTKLFKLGAVSSQILACQEVIKKSIELNIKNINIYYDYDGIEKWANGDWKSNKDETINYHNFIQNVKSKINIKFIKNNKDSSKEQIEVKNLAREAAGYENLKEEEEIIKNNYNLCEKSIMNEKHIKKRIIRNNYFKRFELKKLPNYIKDIFK